MRLIARSDISRLCRAFVLATCLAPCSPSAHGTESPVVVEQQDAQMIVAVESYVHQTRGWARDDYRIELRRRESDVFDFWVLHKDDTKRPPDLAGGGGKSFAVDLDPKSLRVLRELHFQ